MTDKSNRPSSTRTAIVTLFITFIGIVIAGASLLKEAPAPAGGNSIVENSSDIQAGVIAGSINAQGDVNITTKLPSPKPVEPAHTIVINNEDYNGLLTFQDIDNDILDDWNVCFNTKLAFSNNTKFDIPIQLGLYSTDFIYDVMVVKSGESKEFNSPVEEGKWLLSNSENGGIYFVMNVGKKC